MSFTGDSATAGSHGPGILGGAEGRSGARPFCAGEVAGGPGGGDVADEAVVAGMVSQLGGSGWAREKWW